MDLQDIYIYFRIAIIALSESPSSENIKIGFQ